MAYAYWGMLYLLSFIYCVFTLAPIPWSHILLMSLHITVITYLDHEPLCYLCCVKLYFCPIFVRSWLHQIHTTYSFAIHWFQLLKHSWQFFTELEEFQECYVDLGPEACEHEIAVSGLQVLLYLFICQELYLTSSSSTCLIWGSVGSSHACRCTLCPESDGVSKHGDG